MRGYSWDNRMFFLIGAGLLIAIPFALRDMGFRLPLRSKGILVADIGMTLDDTLRRSTFKVKEPYHMGDGSWSAIQDEVFDFQIGDSGARFPLSRYYWIRTPINDRHITELNIGISPRKMPRPEFDTFKRSVRQQLLATGWTPGHFLADSEETVRLWGGKHSTGEGRYWARGGTLLILEDKRMDDERRDEPPDSGEFIVDAVLRPKDHEPKLVFEPSAMPNN